MVVFLNHRKVSVSSPHRDSPANCSISNRTSATRSRPVTMGEGLSARRNRSRSYDLSSGTACEQINARSMNTSSHSSSSTSATGNRAPFLRPDLSAFKSMPNAQKGTTQQQQQQQQRRSPPPPPPRRSRRLILTAPSTSRKLGAIPSKDGDGLFLK